MDYVKAIHLANGELLVINRWTKRAYVIANGGKREVDYITATTRLAEELAERAKPSM